MKVGTVESERVREQRGDAWLHMNHWVTSSSGELNDLHLKLSSKGALGAIVSRRYEHADEGGDASGGKIGLLLPVKKHCDKTEQ